MRKIWQEEAINNLSSYKNLRDKHKKIIPEIIKFVEVNQPILSEWVLDQWVEDRNLGRVQLWEGDWRVIPMPLNVVGTTTTEDDFELSEMVSFVELFNTTTEKVKEVLPQLTESMKQARKNVGASTCWDGYKAKGTKMKGGKKVPNCVKEFSEWRKVVAEKK